MPVVSATSHLWRNVTLFDGLQTLPSPMAVWVAAGRVAGLWPESDFRPELAAGAEWVGEGGVLTPGLVDCHTHLVHAGQRAGEFEQCLEGASYADIARAGGGILGTVRATRAASAAELLAVSQPRLQALIDEGVTTVEIKSGYGLTVADELKSLRVARQLGETLPVRVVTTLLGAHAVPPEFQGDADGYVELVCQELIPAAVAEGLADAVDVFCEGIAFSPAQCERVFQAARAHGLPIKAHAEQLSNLGGSALAARFGALSADHVEYLDEAGVRALAAAGSVAVLLPGAFLMLGETQLPPIALLRRHGVPLALASDANPGTSPVLSLRLMLNLGCTLFGLTPEEALAGVTLNAARALGLADRYGSLEAGKYADFIAWDITRPAELAYWLGGQLDTRIIRHGKELARV